MIRDRLNKIFYKKNQEDPLDKAEVLVFLKGCLAAAWACVFYDKAGLLNSTVFFLSMIFSVCFFVFAFMVRRKPQRIITFTLILYSLLLILSFVANHSIFFKTITANFIIYLFLVKAVKETRQEY